MGQHEPSESGSKPAPGLAENPFPAKAGWQASDQYRVNQPHDRTARRLSQS
jgi:hypothetical protein